MPPGKPNDSRGWFIHRCSRLTGVHIKAFLIYSIQFLVELLVHTHTHSFTAAAAITSISTSTTTVIADNIWWEEQSHLVDGQGLQINRSRARKFGVEDSFTTTAHGGYASDRTHIHLDRRLETQDTGSVDQQALAALEFLLYHRSHGHQKGPFSVFDRLNDEVHPAAAKGHCRIRRIEPRADRRHGVAKPDCGAQKGISQRNNLSRPGHVDRDNDTGIVGRHSDVTVPGALVAVRDLKKGSTAGQAAKGVSEARQLAVHFHALAHVGHGTREAHDLTTGTHGELNDLCIGSQNLVIGHFILVIGHGGGNPQLEAFQHSGAGSTC
mmetsp:Transcript_1048/g.2692  ORF Transcript_1048/g.2692 Transcript_1048/m.2692 type:complete len:324 (+) Transcript_1048:377-1348(+)